MSNHEVLTDEYVAELLAKDAKESSIRYSSIGLKAYIPSRPPANKPKPNTRFLRNIIKDTDNHNAILLAKEAAEARERLRRLKYNESRGTGMNPSDRATRKNQLREITSIIERKPASRKTASEMNFITNHINTNDDELTQERPLRSRREKDKACERDHSKRNKDEKDHRSKDRSDPHEEIRRHSGRYKTSHRSRSRSPRKLDSRNREKLSRKRSRSAECHKSRRARHHYSPHSDDHSKIRITGRQASKISVPISNTDSDSDPLNDIIGPHPAPEPEVRTRGRGTISAASGIDSRFSAFYDPNTDVQLESDEENHWDQVLEAFRDRQKFKEKGIERLRAAGFTEEEIQRLERSGERRVKDFHWSKPGERREWDKGKVVDSDGTVGFESCYGRLKDN